jgi:signal transduction histidine kinase
MIERSCVLQVRLIGDLLDLSRVGAGKLQLDWRDVDLAQVARVALDSCRAGALDKRVDVEEDFPPALGLVRGDPDRLQQIVGNLVSNAIKFTPEGGRVQVRLERVDERLRLIVRDTGEGIAAEALPHIFERFRQENSASVRRHSGLGLGLAIVRHLVDVHGGTVEAESPGKGLGATFTVTLPLKGRPLVAATEEESGPRSVAL